MLISKKRNCFGGKILLLACARANAAVSATVSTKMAQVTKLPSFPKEILVHFYEIFETFCQSNLLPKGFEWLLNQNYSIVSFWYMIFYQSKSILEPLKNASLLLFRKILICKVFDSPRYFRVMFHSFDNVDSLLAVNLLLKCYFQYQKLSLNLSL